MSSCERLSHPAHLYFFMWAGPQARCMHYISSS